MESNHEVPKIPTPGHTKKEILYRKKKKKNASIIILSLQVHLKVYEVNEDFAARAPSTNAVKPAAPLKHT